MATARKTTKSTEPAEKKAYAVLSRLDHDGETYLPGDTVELTEDEAGVLVTLGVLAAADAAKA